METTTTSSSPQTREHYIFMAQTAERAERYDDMVSYMKKIVHFGQELSIEERNLLSIGYKNIIGARRASWRIISSIEQKERGKFASTDENSAVKKRLEYIKNYRSSVENELNSICHDILNILNDYLIPKCVPNESKVFYHKMKGDYYRYLAEYSVDDVKRDVSNKAEEAYQEASQIAEAELAPIHPIRLGLALNFSVFYYEISNSPERACELAKKAYNQAFEKINELEGDTGKDSTLIMQLLRDNLSLWDPKSTEETENEK